MNREFEDLQHAGFDLSLSRLQMFKDWKRRDLLKFIQMIFEATDQKVY